MNVVPQIADTLNGKDDGDHTAGAKMIDPITVLS